MPSLLELLANTHAVSELTQYPDARLYNAATLLKPEDRPTVPVRLFDRDTDLSEFGYAKTRRPHRSILNAFTPRERDRVMVASDSKDFQMLQKLAAILAHEQRHVTGGTEAEAQQKEAEVLGGLDREAMLKLLEKK